jgi:hypothetical protein
MATRLLALAVVLVLCTPAQAAAAAIKLEPRLVSGDAMHYTETVRVSVASKQFGNLSYEFRMGFGLAMEDDDGSVTVRETIESIDATGGDLSQEDLSAYLEGEYTFTVHPDGSISDFQLASGDVPAGGFGVSSLMPSFPPGGLEVGQSYEATLPLDFGGLSDSCASLPVRVTLEGLVVEHDRPAARLAQVFKLTQLEMPFGPFGAAGTARVRADGKATSFVALDTGWPLRTDMAVTYNIALESEGQQQSVDAQLSLELIQDEQTLNDDSD